METATTEAPAAAATPPTVAASTPAPAATPSPGLLGITPATATQAAPAASDPSGVTAAASPSDPALPTPYFARMVADNPDLKPYEATLARFHEPTTAEDYVKVLGKSYGELAKFKGILVPGADATPQDIANHHKINGIPNEAPGYKFGETLGEQFKSLGIEDPKIIGKYEEMALKAHATPEQFRIFMEGHGEIVKELTASAESVGNQAHDQNVAGLQGEWKDSFAAKVGDAQKLHDIAFAGAKLTESEQRDMEAFVKTTAYTKMLDSLGQRISKESSVHLGQPSVFQGDASKLKQSRDSIIKDPKHPFNDHTHRDHAEAVEAFRKLAVSAE